MRHVFLPLLVTAALLVGCGSGDTSGPSTSGSDAEHVATSTSVRYTTYGGGCESGGTCVREVGLRLSENLKTLIAEADVAAIATAGGNRCATKPDSVSIRVIVVDGAGNPHKVKCLNGVPANVDPLVGPLRRTIARQLADS